MHELITAPFLADRLLVRPGHSTGVKLPPPRYLELRQAVDREAPTWLSQAALRTWTLDLASRQLSGALLVRQPSPNGYAASVVPPRHSSQCMENRGISDVIAPVAAMQRAVDLITRPRDLEFDGSHAATTLQEVSPRPPALRPIEASCLWGRRYPICRSMRPVG